MKYFIIRDRSDIYSRLAVFDSFGENAFTVSGEISGNNHTLQISDNSGEVLASITSSPFAFPHFRVRFGRKLVVFMMTPKLKSPMVIYGINASFDGVLLTGEYILNGPNNELIASQKHGWCSKGECHELEIFDERYTLLALAVSAAISIYYGIYGEKNIAGNPTG